jgi:hypothetical protein
MYDSLTGESKKYSEIERSLRVKGASCFRVAGRYAYSHALIRTGLSRNYKTPHIYIIVLNYLGR